MSQFPVYVFDGSTDYEAVEETVYDMVSYLDDLHACECDDAFIMNKLNSISFKLFAMLTNDADHLNNVERWKADVKACYSLLYPLT